MERLHLLIPGSALSIVITAFPLLSKSLFQIFISHEGIVVTPGACIGTDHSPQPSYINHFLLCDLLSEIISPEILQGK